MAVKDKYYGTNIFLYSKYRNAIINLGYKGSHNQFRIVCRSTSMAEANRMCDKLHLGEKVFTSGCTSQTGNDKEIELADKYGIIISIDGTLGLDYVGIEELIETINNLETNQ